MQILLALKLSEEHLKCEGKMEMSFQEERDECELR